VPAETLSWVDGERAEQLALPDRGLDFGDGLFETLLLVAGSPVWLPAHQLRLEAGLQRLGFPAIEPLAPNMLRTIANAVADKQWPYAALRVTVSRGAGPRGYAPPAAAQPRCIYTATEFPLPPARECESESIAILQTRWPCDAALAGLKHLNRLPQVLAARELAALSRSEGLMLGQQGELISVVAGNIFLRRGDRLLTPALDGAGIAGTRRQRVLDSWGAELGCEVVEQTLTRDDLKAAEEAFYCNTLRGFRPLSQVGEFSYSDFSAAHALQALYVAEFAQ
jgi:4-amino-4-deoxychorismate lyase